MNDRVFVDTNVLVYAFDASEPEKKAAALDLLDRGRKEGNLVVSVQVLQELYVTVTRKLTPPLPEREALEAVEKLALLPVVAADRDLVLDGIRGSQRLRISFWDALIVAAARRAGARRLLTEDLSHGQDYDGVTAFDPFR